MALQNLAQRGTPVTANQSQRTRELLQRMTRSAPGKVERWGSVDGHVAVALDRDAALTQNGQLALFTVVNILSRLHPVVTSIMVEIDHDIPLLVNAQLFTGDSVTRAVNSSAPACLVVGPRSRTTGSRLEQRPAAGPGNNR